MGYILSKVGGLKSRLKGSQGGSVMDCKQAIDALINALKEYQRFNGLRNDTDAYLYALGEYALAESEEKPNPDDYGINFSNATRG